MEITSLLTLQESSKGCKNMPDLIKESELKCEFLFEWRILALMTW